MPPKAKGKAPKLHELAVEIPVGFKFADTSKKEFVLGKQFATGGFGRIYTCTETGKKEQLCVKVEPAGNGPLFVEIAVFQRALKPEMIQAYCKEQKLKSVGVPPMISGGIFDYKDDKMRFLIMPKYSGSLEALREKSGKLDEAVAITVAKAVVRSLDYLAAKNYTHGDIKSANILLPSPTDFDGAILVDFGLARMASSNVEKADKKRAHNGTAIFTSLDAHRGFQPSYRGDIEILVYNVVYWISGKLPWLPKESNPAAVQAEKELWEKSAEKEIEKLVGPAIGAPLAKIYRLAQKTSYTDFVDTKTVIKLLDQALAACKKSSTVKKSDSTPKAEAKPSTSRKVSAKKKPVRVEESDEEEEVEVKPKKTTARRGRKPVAESDEEEEVMPKKTVRRGKKPVEESDDDEEVLPKKTARRGRKPTIDSEESGGEEEQVTPLPKLVKKKATVPKRAGSETPELLSVSASREDRMRKRTASAEPASSTSKKTLDAKRRPIPGLINTLPKRIEEEDGESGEEEEEDENSSREEEEEAAPGVSSAVKANMEELRRMVPGMRNLQKGRRSEIIAQIAKKHKK